MSGGFKVMARQCGRCLMSKIPLVSRARVRQLLAECRRKDVSFICHLGSMNDQEIACRAHFETGIGQLARIAGRLGAVVEVDPAPLEIHSEFHADARG